MDNLSVGKRALLDWHNRLMRERTVCKKGLMCFSCTGVHNDATHKAIDSNSQIGNDEFVYRWSLPFSFKPCELLLRFDSEPLITSLAFGTCEQLVGSVEGRLFQCAMSFTTYNNWRRLTRLPSLTPQLTLLTVFPREEIVIRSTEPLIDIGMYGHYLEES